MSRKFQIAFAMLIVTLSTFAWLSHLFANDPIPAKRELWTTGKITGSPEAPPKYAAPRIMPNTKFVHPLLWTHLPKSTLVVIGEQAGKLFTIDLAKPDQAPKLVIDLKADWKKLKPNADAKEFEFVYGIVFHPQFETNRKCYVSYTLKGAKGKKTGPFDHEKNLPDGTRVSEFIWQDTATIDPATEKIIITWPQGGHNGADMHFGNDGMLYISTGDAADPNPPDPLKTGTDCSDLLSSILRIDIDHHDPGQNYAIPKDNPFVKLAPKVRPEIWSYGYRNPWRMSFDRPTGQLWIGDVGWEQWEMVHIATSGSNHGWSIVEGRQPINSQLKAGPTANITPPVIELDHTQAASVTGGYVYRGSKFPELVGKYIFGDYMTKRIWAATVKDGQTSELVDLVDPTIRIVTFGIDQSNEIYFVDYDTGTIHTLERNIKPSYDPKAFPTTLSTTGLFSKTDSHDLAKGVQSFEINAEAWMDGATATRFFAVPGDGKIVEYDGRKQLGGNIEWLPFTYHFPKDSVLGKTLTMNKKRIETQILHYDGRYWQAYSYRWRDDQSDADLVPADGAEVDLTIPDEIMPDGKRRYTWNFNSRVQCLTCHTPWAEVSLAFSPLNLNRDGRDGKNQLVNYCESGLLERRKKDDKPMKPHTAQSVKSMDALTNPHDTKASLTNRARSYLHINCSHCHRNGGGGSVAFELTKDGDIKKNIWDCPPTRGSFGISDAKVIAPGHPFSSTLLYRMAKFGRDRMPHIGAELPDPKGVTLIAEWISEQKPVGDRAAISGIAGHLTIEGMLRNAVIAMSEKKAMTVEGQQQIMTITSGPIRDLFEGYLPQTGERKLGANPRPKAILSLKGDAERGQAIYLKTQNQCVNCHKMNGEGKEIGPDLSKIGQERTREQLLESILEPSRRIDAKYQTFNLLHMNGKTFVGVMVKSDEKSVTLRDALGADIMVARSDIEELKSSPVSLMASGQLQDFTAQQAADLLEFLATRKK